MLSIVSQAVEQMSEEEKGAQVREAMSLIKAITTKRAQVVQLQDEIANAQKELKKLDFTPKTVEDVLG